jgi:hypothetical protein
LLYSLTYQLIVANTGGFINKSAEYFSGIDFFKLESFCMDDSHNIFLGSSIVPTKIDVCDLRVGMYVCQLDKPWLESSFLFQGFELKNQEDVDAVRQECQFVYIDVEKQSIALKFQHKSAPYISGSL